MASTAAPAPAPAAAKTKPRPSLESNPNEDGKPKRRPSVASNPAEDADEPPPDPIEEMLGVSYYDVLLHQQQKSGRASVTRLVYVSKLPAGATADEYVKKTTAVWEKRASRAGGRPSSEDAQLCRWTVRRDGSERPPLLPREILTSSSGRRSRRASAADETWLFRGGARRRRGRGRGCFRGGGRGPPGRDDPDPARRAGCGRSCRRRPTAATPTWTSRACSWRIRRPSSTFSRRSAPTPPDRVANPAFEMRFLGAQQRESEARAPSGVFPGARLHGPDAPIRRRRRRDDADPHVQRGLPRAQVRRLARAIRDRARRGVRGLLGRSGSRASFFARRAGFVDGSAARSESDV